VVSLRGVVASGLGQGAQFMAVPWVREGIRRLIGFDPYSGTLNVRLVDLDALVAWRRIREGSALRLVPPPPETCGARLFRPVVAPDVSAAIVVPDVTRYGDDTLELVAAVHVRNHFGLHDRDPVTLRMRAALAPGSF
jgi:riboflavin kinase, archaea type